MGNWHLSIRGIGPHHGADQRDADRLVQRFVQEMHAAGHTIVDAVFTYGGGLDELAPAVEPPSHHGAE